jgi:hypothetical protein
MAEPSTERSRLIQLLMSAAEPVASYPATYERSRLIGMLMSAAEPMTSYPATYAEMNREARDAMSAGASRMTAPDADLWERAKGAGVAGLGALEFVSSPVNAALRTVVGEPFAKNFGVPREYPELVAGMAIPGAGVGRTGRAAAKALPMDEASRTARAKEMGFHLDMPLYHGSDTAFRAFDLSKGGRMTGAAPARQGVWTALDPTVAEEFAQMAAQAPGSRGNAQIYRLVHRSDRPGTIRLSGDESNHEIAATLAQAWDDGFTSVLLKNYTTPGGKIGKEILVVKDPNQLRVPWATFDPNKKESSRLTAGLAGLSIPAAYSYGTQPE